MNNNSENNGPYGVYFLTNSKINEEEVKQEFSKYGTILSVKQVVNNVYINFIKRTEAENCLRCASNSKYGEIKRGKFGTSNPLNFLKDKSNRPRDNDNSPRNVNRFEKKPGSASQFRNPGSSQMNGWNRDNKSYDKHSKDDDFFENKNPRSATVDDIEKKKDKTSQNSPNKEKGNFRITKSQTPRHLLGKDMSNEYSGQTADSPPPLRSMNDCPPPLRSRNDCPPPLRSRDDCPPPLRSRDDRPPPLRSRDDCPPPLQSRDNCPPLRSRDDCPPPLRSRGDCPPPLRSRGDCPPPLQSRDDCPPSLPSLDDRPSPLQSIDDCPPPLLSVQKSHPPHGRSSTNGPSRQCGLLPTPPITMRLDYNKNMASHLTSTSISDHYLMSVSKDTSNIPPPLISANSHSTGTSFQSSKNSSYNNYVDKYGKYVLIANLPEDATSEEMEKVLYPHIPVCVSVPEVTNIKMNIMFCLATFRSYDEAAKVAKKLDEVELRGNSLTMIRLDELISFSTVPF